MTTLRSTDGHGKQRAGGLCGFLALMLTVAALLSGPVAGQGAAERKREQARLKEQKAMQTKTVAHPAGFELQNVCDLPFGQLLYCFCDSLNANDATTARCTVYNVTDQNDRIWQNFGTQRKIQELELKVHEEGRLTFLPQIVLSLLPPLETLQVQGANIDELLPNSFADSPQLTTLVLTNNKIHHIRQLAFQGLSKVTELELGQNLLGSLERGAFSGLEKLRTLSLARNNISLVEDSVFSTMPHLKELDLSHNRIAVLTSETLLGLPHLQKLSLRNNPMTIIGDHTFARVPQLRRLDLSSNLIEIVRDQALAGLVHLNNLNLSDNKLQVFDRSALAPIWPNLSNASMIFSLKGNPLGCDCRIRWLANLKAISGETVKSNLENLTCTLFTDGGETDVLLFTVLSSMDCRSTAAPSTTMAVSKRPTTIVSTTRTTLSYELEDEPVNVKKQANSNGASLHLASDSKTVVANEPVTTKASNRAQASTTPSIAMSLIVLVSAVFTVWN